jgi:membrane fusion protein, multidrug efflux system
MRKRMIIMLTVVAAVVAILGFVKYNQIQTAMAEFASFQQPPEAVTTVVAEPQAWDATLQAIGSVTAVQGVSVSADLPGLVERIRFDSGDTVRRGEVLVELDTRQEQAQLAAARAQLNLAKTQLDRMAGLREKGVTSQAELDTAQATFEQAEARVGEIQAAIARKVIRAPFGGVLGLRQVDLGQYVSGGDPLVSLQSLDPIRVVFSVPQQQLGRLRAGTPVSVTAEVADTEDGMLSGEEGVPTGATAITRQGRVTAVDSVIDEATRNIRVQATFDNPQGMLRPGMFVDVEVTTGADMRVIAVPASAISYAPYGDSVFVVEEMEGEDGRTYQGVSQHIVQVGPARGDLVAITGGLEPGSEVVTSGVFKLRNGAPVQVNNDVQPGSDVNPTPENS